MLSSLDALEKAFEATVKKSKEDCGDELEKIRQLTLDIIPHFFKSIMEYRESLVSKYMNSLVDTCFLELFRTSGHTLFLSCNGLYRNAFDNIRHTLESIVQALYVDMGHPKADLETKIEVLKEIEDKTEYHAVRLINKKLKIEHRDKLREEYKKLSGIIHPSHKQIIATIVDLKKGDEFPATVDCEMISKIYDSMKVMYDMFFFLFLYYFPEVKKPLQKNLEFIKSVKVYNLVLLSKVFKV